MISRTVFFASLLGCAILIGCSGSEDSPQPSESTFDELAASKEVVKSLQSQIAALQAQNAELVAANEYNVATLQVTIDELSKRISDLPTTAEANGLRKQLSDLRGEASNLKEQIDVKKTEIKELEKKIAAIPAGETAESLVQALEDKKDLERKIAAIPAGETVESLVKALEGKKNEIKDLEKKIAAIPAGETVESLVKALEEKRQSLEAMTEKVAGLEAKVALLAKLVPPAAGTVPPPPPAENLASWEIVNRDFKETFTHQPFVSNGYIGLRLPAAGQGQWIGKEFPDNISGHPHYKNERFTSAMVEKFYTDNQVHLATLPNWSSLTIRGGGTNDSPFFDPNHLKREQVDGYEQVVDMRKGIVTTSLIWLPSEEKRVKLKWTAFAHRTNKHVGVIRLEITPLKWTGDIRVHSYLDFGGLVMASVTGENYNKGLSARSSVKTPAGTGFKATTEFQMEVPDGVGSPQVWDDKNINGMFWNFTPEVNRTYAFTKYVGIATSLDDGLIVKLGRQIPQNVPDSDKTVDAAATAFATAAKLTGYDTLLRTHIAGWEALWSKSSVTVENERLQKVINSAQYELLSSTYEGSKASIPAGGLLSTGYGGMIFWDAETWMFPYLLLTYPELARTVVDYRFANLEKALNNARNSIFDHDPGTKPYHGTYFPWVSGTGNMSGEGNEERNRRQIHLQADIALAQYQYYAATGDTAFLKTQAWPILKGIANFYVTRGEFSVDNAKSHLNTVTGGMNIPKTKVTRLSPMGRQSRQLS